MVYTATEALGVAEQRDRLTLSRSCLNKAAYHLREVEADMALFVGGEAAELAGVVRDAAKKAEAARDAIRAHLGEAR